MSIKDTQIQIMAEALKAIRHGQGSARDIARNALNRCEEIKKEERDRKKRQQMNADYEKRRCEALGAAW